MHGSPLILIVDDEPFNIDVLEQELADLGYEAVSAADGQAALDQVEASAPDLVLLDIMMPVMDGFAVLSRLKGSATTRDIPVVVVSALSDIGSVAQGIRLGADDYLPKPFDPVLLQARIESCLERKRYRDQEVEYLRQVERLTFAASDVERNAYDPASLQAVSARPDALGNLARVFQRMAHQVQVREQRLRRQLRQVTLDMEEHQQEVAESVANYVPMDRRQALARGEMLPERTSGAALFVDVSGFSALTESLTQALGLQRGAEELIRHLNQVFSVLTDDVHRYRGSVVSFGGDAMTAWFDADDGRRATACAASMQRLIASRAIAAPLDDTVPPFSIKIAVAAGPVRRLLLGNPDIQVIDTIAGRLVEELTLAERLAKAGEVLVPASLAETIGEHLAIAEWRTDAASGMRFAVVTAADADPVAPWPDLPPNAHLDSAYRTWLLPAVHERVRDGKSEFLAELRPAAALFVGFGGVDVDDEAGAVLDGFVRRAQAVVTRYGGAVLQVTIGDKGSYLYATFGVPVAHEDDAVRAVAAALELCSFPSHDRSIAGIRIGLAYGQMRAGAYGGPARRTYGAQGQAANFAAHLMQHAGNDILCDEAIQRGARKIFAFEPMPPITAKSGTAAMPVFRPVASTVQSAVARLFDELPLGVQLTLKVACVIGTAFPTRVVEAIHPVADDRPCVRAHLAAAAAVGIVTQTAGGQDPIHAFADSVTRDHLYRLLLFAQRRRLHRAAAGWYEQTYGPDLAPHASTLASHWLAAEDRAKASHYYEMAADHARANDAARDAERFLLTSIALTTDPDP